MNSRLNVKEVIQLAAVISITCGAITSIVAYIHADVTIPKILNRTSEQIDKAIERHAKYPHPPSASKSDLERVEQSIKEDLKEWKNDTRTRLDRIEQKISTR